MSTAAPDLGAATWEAYQDGDLEPERAFDVFLGEYARLERQITTLERAKATLRERIEQVVDTMGGQVSRGGWEARVRPPVVALRYDNAKIATLLVRLHEQGQGETATAVYACAVESVRRGGLELRRERALAAPSAPREGGDDGV